MQIDPEIVSKNIETFIRYKVDEYRRDGVILGMSGGVDSSLVASLLVRALGPDKVHTLLLPERDSSPDSKTDAMVEIERLGVGYQEIDLAPILSAIGIYKQLPLQYLGTRRIKETVVKQQHQRQVEKLGETPFLAGLLGTRDIENDQHVIDAGNAYARVKHRIRMVILYYYAEVENRLVIGTTNKSEAMTGFVVKWGDNAADIEPILPLYKTQVFQLASYLGVNQEIIDKAPSPDLMPGIVDEFALGIDYATLDKILWGIDRGWEILKITETYNVETSQVEHVRELIRRSEHIRKSPPYPDLKMTNE
jgi:NAD+ synthase